MLWRERGKQLSRIGLATRRSGTAEIQESHLTLFPCTADRLARTALLQNDPSFKVPAFKVT